MHWDDQARKLIATLTPVAVDAALSKRIVSLLDLTRLNATDTEADMALFLEKAHTAYGSVAAVCVYPTFLRLAVAELAGGSTKVATVANFPEGMLSLETVLVEIGYALQNGAQEIDVVFPYHRYLANERSYAQTFVTACKAACGTTTLKVILETGALKELSLIAAASVDALMAGADFIKTSTGKISAGATLEAAATMLFAIQEVSQTLHRPIGVKMSGGIKTIQEAAQYIQLADKIMGRDWVTSATFRIGASQLVDQLTVNIDANKG